MYTSPIYNKRKWCQLIFNLSDCVLMTTKYCLSVQLLLDSSSAFMDGNAALLLLGAFLFFLASDGMSILFMTFMRQLFFSSPKTAFPWRAGHAKTHTWFMWWICCSTIVTTHSHKWCKKPIKTSKSAFKAVYLDVAKAMTCLDRSQPGQWVQPQLCQRQATFYLPGACLPQKLLNTSAVIQ